MDFIAAHWSAEHVLANQRELLLWQHARSDEFLNFVIARSERGIEGVLGFVSSNCSGDREDSGRVLWLALWKIREDCRKPMLGLLLFRYLARNESFDGLGCLGFNETTQKLLAGMGYTIGTLEHYYLPNREAGTRVLLGGTVDYGQQERANVMGEATLFKSVSAQDIEGVCKALLAATNGDFLPRRGVDWYLGRYLKHPVYRYHIMGLFAGADIVAMLVFRQVAARGGLALRIVDFVGDESALGHSSEAFQALLDEYRAEYVDFLNSGLNDEYLRACGFRVRRDGDGVVVPQYFEPFVPENRDIQYAFKSSLDLPWRIFKGDGDQDRPNIIN